MRFIRQLCIKHHPTGDHYVLAIPAVVAQALDLRDGGLVSLEYSDNCYHKKRSVRLQAYRDSAIPWREAFNLRLWTDPTVDLFRPIPVPPNTLGRSRPTSCGKTMDFKATRRESREGLRFIQAALEMLKRKAFPHGYKRGPKRRRGWFYHLLQ